MPAGGVTESSQLPGGSCSSCGWMRQGRAFTGERFAAGPYRYLLWIDRLAVLFLELNIELRLSRHFKMEVQILIDYDLQVPAKPFVQPEVGRLT